MKFISRLIIAFLLFLSFYGIIGAIDYQDAVNENQQYKMETK